MKTRVLVILLSVAIGALAFAFSQSSAGSTKYLLDAISGAMLGVILILLGRLKNK